MDKNQGPPLHGLSLLGFISKRNEKLIFLNRSGLPFTGQAGSIRDESKPQDYEGLLF